MDWDDVRDLRSSLNNHLEDYDREQDELKRRVSRLADVVEMLAKDRHERLGHRGPFPSALTHLMDSCQDALCIAAHQEAT